MIAVTRTQVLATRVDLVCEKCHDIMKWEGRIFQGEFMHACPDCGHTQGADRMYPCWEGPDHGWGPMRMPEEKAPVLSTLGIRSCKDRGCTLLWLAEARIAAFEGALRGEKFARAELEEEVRFLRNEIGVCDKHGTLNHVMDAWCLRCDEEYNERKRREQR